MERTFTKGENTRTVASPVEAVRLVADGWREVAAETVASEPRPTDENGDLIPTPDEGELAEDGSIPDETDAGDTPDAD